MATFRDDLGRIGRRLLETVEDRSGVEVVRSEDLRLLESDRNERRRLEKTLDFIGFSLINYQGDGGGRLGGVELRPQARRFLSKQSLAAWLEDPLAGQSVDLYLSFVFGRGVPMPQAHDPEVQDVLDRTWKDPSNKRALTSYEKLIERGVDLCLDSNVVLTFFDDGEDGMVRVSDLPPDDIEDVIRHDELAPAELGDRNRILYYKVCERVVRYKFEDGSRVQTATGSPDQAARTVYYEALGAFDPDDPVQARQDEGLRTPPQGQLRAGKVVHLAVNKTSRMAFGVPRMRRLIPWYNAYQDTIKSHVDRMKAMASVYMQATVKGNQRDLDRLAHMATGRRSAFGEADADPGRPRAPMGPGILGGNESLRYEPFKIDSGAQDVQASAPVMRSQITGPWPDSYLSGFANGALAGATALELPSLKFVEREQELWVHGLLRPLGDCAIKAAIRVGDLTEWRDPTEAELAQLQAAEEAGEPAPFEVNPQGQVKRDLTYEISLPSPLQRTMGDLVTAAVETATAVDPNGQNPDLSRWLFGFILAEAFDVADPQRVVDQVLPRQMATVLPTDQPNTPAAAPAAAAAEPGAVGADGQRHNEANPYGAPRNSPPADEQRVQEAAVDAIAAAARRGLQINPLEISIEQLLATASTNGHGAH